MKPLNSVNPLLAISAVFALTGVPVAASPQDGAPTLVPVNAVAILNKLGGVMVEVSRIAPDAETAGLSRDLLAEIVSTQLQRAHIPVLTLDEGKKAPGHPTLFVDVETAHRRSGEPAFAFSLRVQLRETTRLERNPALAVYGATTWEDGEIGTVSTDKIDGIRKDVMEYTSHFIDAYRSLNAKSAP